jgi:hypothetical protein
MLKWFHISWWKYLLEKRSEYSDISFISTVICRAKGHPCGFWYINTYGLEPDMHCKNCGDDLG